VGVGTFLHEKKLQCFPIESLIKSLQTLFMEEFWMGWWYWADDRSSYYLWPETLPNSIGYHRLLSCRKWSAYFCFIPITSHK